MWLKARGALRPGREPFIDSRQGGPKRFLLDESKRIQYRAGRVKPLNFNYWVSRHGGWVKFTESGRVPPLAFDDEGPVFSPFHVRPPSSFRGSITSISSTTEAETNWTSTWAAAIVADPYSSENVESRLKDLLDGKTVLGVPGRSKKGKAKNVLEGFVLTMDWTFMPSAFDDIWHAVFKIAKKLGCTESVREATYFWTETYLFHEAWDVYPKEEADNDDDVCGGDYDNSWISASLGDARLYALGYGYSGMRIGTCAQLLGAGQRLKLHFHGGGDSRETPGFAGRYLQARPEKEQEGEAVWGRVLKALENQQAKSGPRAAVLLKRTLEHLKSDAGDMTSAEVAAIVWHSSQTAT